MMAGSRVASTAAGDRCRRRLCRAIRLRARTHTPISEVVATLFSAPRRTLVGLSLMAAQAFFYNAIFFTYALVLTDFYGIARRPCRLVHPAVRAREFARAGLARAAVRYARPPPHDGIHLCRLGRAAGRGRVPVRSEHCRRGAQTIGWMIIFFFASAAASAAYLTVSETFPLEIRALAIAFFYADRHRRSAA